MRRIFFSIIVSLVAVFGWAGYSYAATMYLSPASGNMITGCDFYVDVLIDTAGDSTNGTQLYIDDNLDGGGDSLSISAGNMFTTYAVPDGVPAGLKGYIGYGGTQNGSGLRFARLKLKSSNIGKNVTADIHFDLLEDVTSKIAQDPSSENILSSVTGGSYTVVDGFCETSPPNITNVNPEDKKPNHAVDANLNFTISDSGSGVNINTLNVRTEQDGTIVNYAFDDAQLTYSGSASSYEIEIDPLTNFLPEVKVEWTISATDFAGNSVNRIYSFNDLTCEQLGCIGSPIDSQCNDGIDNDGDGTSDLLDSDCTDILDNNEFGYIEHDCTDGIDNDGDGQIDYNDPACTTEVESAGTPIGGSNPECNDNIDNDGDGLIDYPEDDGCEAENDNSESDPGIQGALSIQDLSFFTANNTIQLFPSGSGAITMLGGAQYRVFLDLSNVTGTIDTVTLQQNNLSYQLFFDNATGKYTVALDAPDGIGVFNNTVSVLYGDESVDEIPFSVASEGRGVVSGRQNGDISPLGGVTVILEEYNQTSGTYTPAGTQTTGGSGQYGFIVGNGTYRLRFQADGYNDAETRRFAVTDNIVNESETLVKQLVPVTDTTTGDTIPVSTSDQINFVGDIVAESVEDIVEIIDDPVVEEVAENNIAPIAAIAAVAAVAPALGLLNLLSYLRFLFLQPLLLLGRKKREGWGIVYDTVTRRPVDLAVVRLVDITTNKVVRSRVTDREGRYVFFVDPGQYRIEVSKQKMIFPSNALRGEREDGPFLDLYHGEPVTVSENNTAIAANIPIDPVGVEKTPGRIKREKTVRFLQQFLAAVSILAGLIAVIISPTLLTIGLLVLQFALFFLFKRLGTPPSPKSWGIVYDARSQKPVGSTVARLFTKKYNKLAATELTDGRGRYSFLVGPNDYYVTFSKQGYEQAKSKDIAVDNSSRIAVQENVKMSPLNGQRPEMGPPKIVGEKPVNPGFVNGNIDSNKQ